MVDGISVGGNRTRTTRRLTTCKGFFRLAALVSEIRNSKRDVSLCGTSVASANCF